MNRSKQLVKYLLGLLLYPFKCGLPLFVCLFYCSCAALLIYKTPHDIKYTAHLCAIGFIMSYCIVATMNLIKLGNKKAITIPIITLGIINLLVDIIIFETTGTELCIDHVYIILGTNPTEGCEFIVAYFHWKTVLVIIGFITGLIISVHLTRRCIRSHIIQNITGAIGLITLVILLVCTNITKSKSYHVVFLGKCALFIQYEPASDLRSYRKTLTLELTKDFQPIENIVLIIGESFSRNHSSLYNYNKPTNPLLDSLRQIRPFYCIDNVSSPESSTILSLKKVLSSYSSKNERDVDWKECITLFDIAKTAGYSTVWISNQSKSGLHDNQITSYADLADTTFWAGITSGMFKKDYDEIIFPYINESKALYSGKKTLTIIHLMGSHPDYRTRFPRLFEHFTADDYLDRPQHQRQTLANYDNSILYNDWIVSQIIQNFDNDAIIIYLSDHAQDIFESSSDFCGHGRNDNQSEYYGKQIPLIITTSNNNTFLSDSWLEDNGLTDESHFCTEDIIYVMAKLMGISSFCPLPKTNNLYHTTSEVD